MLHSFFVLIHLSAISDGFFSERTQNITTTGKLCPQIYCYMDTTDCPPRVFKMCPSKTGYSMKVACVFTVRNPFIHFIFECKKVGDIYIESNLGNDYRFIPSVAYLQSAQSISSKSRVRSCESGANREQLRAEFSRARATVASTPMIERESAPHSPVRDGDLDQGSTRRLAHPKLDHSLTEQCECMSSHGGEEEEEKLAHKEFEEVGKKRKRKEGEEEELGSAIKTGAQPMRLPIGAFSSALNRKLEACSIWLVASFQFQL